MRRALILLLTLGSAAGALASPFTVTTDDGIVLVGQFRPPDRPGVPIAVLLHGLGSNRGEWPALTAALEHDGCGHLSYDARGHGESTRLRAGGAVSYRSFPPPAPGSPWERMVTDLGTVLRALRADPRTKGSPVLLVGASLGANVALAYAASDPAVRGLVLLSPGLDYAGVRTLPAVERLAERRVLLAASPTDRYAFQSVQALRTKLPRATVLTPRQGHGVQMFDGIIEGEIIRWLRP